jgi:hypothetical protein
MNMISKLRRRVLEDGNALITFDEYNQLQREWITRTGAKDMVAAEREQCAAYCSSEGLFQTARAIRANEHWVV